MKGKGKEAAGGEGRDENKGRGWGGRFAVLHQGRKEREGRGGRGGRDGNKGRRGRGWRASLWQGSGKGREGT